MGIITKLNPIARAAGVMGVTAALVTGVTFAAFNSTATLQANTISAADSSILIWDGDSYEATAPGFTIDNLVPGKGSGNNPFYLQNNSGGALYLSAHVPIEPAVPEGGYGFEGWENLIVTFKSKSPSCFKDKHDFKNKYSGVVKTNMKALLEGNVQLPCNTLAQGATGNASEGSEHTEGNYSISFDINPESLIEGATDAGVGPFDLQINGSLVKPSDEEPSNEQPEVPEVTPEVVKPEDN